jgi:hypothetical protein
MHIEENTLRIGAVALALLATSCDSSPKKFDSATNSPSKSTEHFEIWSSPHQPIAHTGHAIALDWDTQEFLYWMASDVMREPATNFPKRGTFVVDENDRIHLGSILDSEVNLKRIDIDGCEALSVEGRDFESALRAGLVLFNRKHGRIEHPWSLAEPTDFEKGRIAKILKEKAEQDGAGQPATRPESKSEDSDNPQPEAEWRSR